MINKFHNSKTTDQLVALVNNYQTLGELPNVKKKT